MKRVFTVMIVLFLLVLFGRPAYAAFIVGSYPDPIPLNVPLQSLSGSSVSNTQWIAWRFTLDKTYEVTDWQAWCYGGTASPSNNVYSQLFTGTLGVGTPDNDDWVSTTHFIVPYSFGNPDNIGWYGPHFDTPLVLDAGTYWISVTSYGDYVGLPDDGSDQVWPIARSGGWNPSAPPEYDWNTSGNINLYHMGFRVLGEAAPVPIPGAVWLLGTGIIGLVGIRRKVKK